MLKVMLVDDEVLVRLGIKSVIDWGAHGFQYVGDAPDGREALELIEQTRPDILLTDIIMPNMNGLELIEVVRKRFPFIRIIVLSSHNEYEYVRKAMKMGVDDYILKTSMKPQELLDMLLETAGKIAENDTEMKERIAPRERPLEDGEAETAARIAARLDGKPDAADVLQLPAGSGCMLLLHVHEHPPLSAESHKTRKTLCNLLELELKKWASGHVVHYRDNEVVVIVSFTDERADRAAELQEMGRDFVSASRRYLNLSLSVGISGPFAGQDALPQAYREAKSAAELYFYEGKEKVYVYADRPACNPDIRIVTKEDEQRLRLEIERIDEAAVNDALEAVFERMYARKDALEKNIQACLKLLHIFQAGFKLYGDEALASAGQPSPLYKEIIAFEELDEAKAWFHKLNAAWCDEARKMVNESYREEIHRLIVYMKANYAEDLSLKRAAAMVNMRESYLSYLFKKETRTGFTEYVNQLRVDKAAELLAATSLPSYLIAEQVGYDNINYFGRVFKKLKGVSPQQYRAQFPKKGT